MKDLASRRARVQRFTAKQPAIRDQVTYAPKPAARDRLIDLLVELLDERRRSGAKGNR